jgi:hypothetical protein
MFAQAGYEADIAAYDGAADVTAQRDAISDAFIEDLCAIGKPADVAAGVARYRAAGATNPMITNITGTDLGPTLHAAGARADQDQLKAKTALSSSDMAGATMLYGPLRVVPEWRNGALAPAWRPIPA